MALTLRPSPAIVGNRTTAARAAWTVIVDLFLVQTDVVLIDVVDLVLVDVVDLVEGVSGESESGLGAEQPPAARAPLRGGGGGAGRLWPRSLSRSRRGQGQGRGWGPSRRPARGPGGP